jgi:predicted transcriptional regulator
MRTTIRLDDALMAEIKREAARTGRTITAFIDEALRESLARRRRPAATARFELPSFGGGRLLPGVDLDDSAALLDLMEAGGGPD